MNRNLKMLAKSMMCLFLHVGYISCSQKYNYDIDNCVSDLKTLLHTEEGWIKVHAAEYLLWTGYGEGIKEVYLEEEKKHTDSIRYRIGIWRVLAQSAENETEKKLWADKIISAFLNEQGMDRVHAVETLAKLKVSPSTFSKSITQDALMGSQQDLSLYTKWSTAYDSESEYNRVQNEFLDALLNSGTYVLNNQQISIIAFALKQMSKLTKEDSELIAQYCLQETETSAIRFDLLSLAYSISSLDEKSSLLTNIRNVLTKDYENKSPKERIQILHALVSNHTKSNIESLRLFYKNEKNIHAENYDADVHATAAYALLKSIKENNI